MYKEGVLHIVDGEAQDGETIVRQRKEMEDFIRSTVGEYDRTELIWNLKDQNNPSGPFTFQLIFYKDLIDSGTT